MYQFNFTELYRLLSLLAFHLRQIKTPVIHSHDSPALLSSIGVNSVVSEGFVRPSADERLFISVHYQLVCHTAVFSVVTLLPTSGEERCVTTLKTAV